MASLINIRSYTAAGIIFRTVLVIAAWYVSLRILDQGIYLFAPGLWPIYGRSEALIALIGTALWLLVLWAVILLPEKRPWSDVGWTRVHVVSSLLFGGLIGSGVYLFYVGVIAACGWYWIVGHYSWSLIPPALLVSLLNALGMETLYWGYLLKSLEMRQGSGVALIIASILYGLEPIIAHLVRAALNKHHAFTFGPQEAQGLILYSAMALFSGAAYLWSRRLWTAVGVNWGCTCMNYLLTDNASDQGSIAVFRFSISPHSFDLTGIVFITKVSIFITAGLVMAYLAKRRGHWQVRKSSKSQS